MTTPMRSQYLAIKKQYPDIILLFRLGDFYETFDDDARIVSSVCMACVSESCKMYLHGQIQGGQA